MNMTRHGVLLTLAILVAVPAAAQEAAPDPTPPPAPSPFQWSLGLGVISSPRPYIGASNQITSIPLLELTYKKWYVQGIQAGYRFIDTEKFSFDMRAGFVFAGLDPDDSPALEGMNKRNSSIEGGFVFDWKPGKYRLSTSVYTDMLGNSNGQQAAIDFSRMWAFNRYRWGLTPSVGVVWQSSNMVDYYVGVTPEEANPDRPAYRGHSAINFRSSLLGFFFINMRVRLVGLIRIQRLDNEILESPIVDKQRGIFGLLGVTYRFGKLPPRPS